MEFSPLGDHGICRLTMKLAVTFRRSSLHIIFAPPSLKQSRDRFTQAHSIALGDLSDRPAQTTRKLHLHKLAACKAGLAPVLFDGFANLLFAGDS